eukprot:scaffold12889_cov105-Isochrysis_galbana.AAC.2
MGAGSTRGLEEALRACGGGQLGERGGRYESTHGEMVAGGTVFDTTVVQFRQEAGHTRAAAAAGACATYAQPGWTSLCITSPTPHGDPHGCTPHALPRSTCVNLACLVLARVGTSLCKSPPV